MPNSSQQSSHCKYCGIDVHATSWATSVESHERTCADIEIRRLEKDNELFKEVLRRLKRIDTKTCLLVTQALRASAEAPNKDNGD